MTSLYISLLGHRPLAYPYFWSSQGKDWRRRCPRGHSREEGKVTNNNVQAKMSRRPISEIYPYFLSELLIWILDFKTWTDFLLCWQWVSWPSFSFSLPLKCCGVDKSGTGLTRSTTGHWRLHSNKLYSTGIPYSVQICSTQNTGTYRSINNFDLTSMSCSKRYLNLLVVQGMSVSLGYP